MEKSPLILDYGRRGEGDPRVGDPADPRSAGPGIIGAAMTLPLAVIGWITLGLPPMGFSPLFRLVSGELFRDRVVSWEANVFDALTPLVIRDFFDYFAFIATPTLLYVAVMGWISGQAAQGGRRAFGVPVAGICVCLLVLLTVPFTWLVQYVRTMGMTQARFNGLACGISAYAVILGFLWWAIRAASRGGPVPAARGARYATCGARRDSSTA